MDVQRWHAHSETFYVPCTQRLQVVCACLAKTSAVLSHAPDYAAHASVPCSEVTEDWYLAGQCEGQHEI